jgi:hypothetical protein
MSAYTTAAFWKGAADRAIATFAQSLLATLTAGSTGIVDLDFGQLASVSGLAALVSLVTSLAYPSRVADTATLTNSTSPASQSTVEDYLEATEARKGRHSK